MQPARRALWGLRQPRAGHPAGAIVPQARYHPGLNFTHPIDTREDVMGVLVGKPAPDFTVPAVLGDGSIVDSFTLSEAIK
ncbi:MAG TPA: hypothetical protein VIN33_16425, partial [Marinobacter sp.]